MIKYAVLFSMCIVMGQSQRPFYAGGRPYPEVLPRFQNNETSTTSSTTSTTSTLADVTLVNRVGENTGSTTVVPVDNAPTKSNPASPASSSTQNPLLQALGFGETAKKVESWPAELQPFWWVNRQQIAEHLNPVNGQQNVVQPGVASRGSFFSG
ncbi:uncharacterized protein LOC124304990 [Neodiprion virginianus]|uniref:uncharacterized protein LOC124304990 n=1 Tax=Neodiprion virginianus TaxID=2961670 RepID=UPI001EE77D9D|nr:uncharacterized protein LOC124304990 [Neodiprion virginianus]